MLGELGGVDLQLMLMRCFLAFLETPIRSPGYQLCREQRRTDRSGMCIVVSWCVNASSQGLLSECYRECAERSRHGGSIHDRQQDCALEQDQGGERKRWHL